MSTKEMVWASARVSRHLRQEARNQSDDRCVRLDEASQQVAGAPGHVVLALHKTLGKNFGGAHHSIRPKHHRSARTPVNESARALQKVAKAQEFAETGNLSRCCQRLTTITPPTPPPAEAAAQLQVTHPPPSDPSNPAPKGRHGTDLQTHPQRCKEQLKTYLLRSHDREAQFWVGVEAGGVKTYRTIPSLLPSFPDSGPGRTTRSTSSSVRCHSTARTPSIQLAALRSSMQSWVKLRRSTAAATSATVTPSLLHHSSKITLTCWKLTTWTPQTSPSLPQTERPSTSRLAWAAAAACPTSWTRTLNFNGTDNQDDAAALDDDDDDDDARRRAGSTLHTHLCGPTTGDERQLQVRPKGLREFEP
eukprot:940064-Rhodomonas_salina.3